jgi:hypothetical protein
MRERATSVGGSLQTGPGPAGGYRVFAALPASGARSDAARSDPAQADPAQSEAAQSDAAPASSGPAQ